MERKLRTKMPWMKISAVIAAASSAFILGCSNMGYQGGAIPEIFQGVANSLAVSPTSLQLSWAGYPGATMYRLYASNQNTPISLPSFTSSLVQPGVNSNNIRYSVTAMDPGTGMEEGDRASYIGPTALLPHSNFKAQGSVASNGFTSIKVSWPAHPSVSYRIYVGEQSADGSVNYNSFIAANGTTAGTGSTVITGLKEGHEYCAITIAAYMDGTNDGPDGTPFTSKISTTLNGWMVDDSGSFANSKIAQSQKCVRTDSNLNVDNVKIYSSKATLSNRPIFYVYNPDTTQNIKIDIYEVNPITGFGTFVGTRNNNGTITAQNPLAVGGYQFYATITDLSGTGALAKKEIIVGGVAGQWTDSSEPTADLRKKIFIRGFNDQEDPNIDSSKGYYPPKQQGGYGSQQAGSSVAIGDFDCDGRMDIAMGIPYSTETNPNDQLAAQMGKVVIYYGLDDTKPPTSAAAKSQIITFDITPYDSAGRNLQLGTSLYVGNFNHDNQSTNQPNSSGTLHVNFGCDDLVIGSGYGPMFVLYGKRSLLPDNSDGGLNYNGSTAYSVNKSSTCDPSSNVCSPGVYTSTGSSTAGAFRTTMGVAITSGDYNGDSYEDLAVTSAGASGVLVFRGSAYGLIPPAPYTGPCTETTSFQSGTLIGFPYIPYSPTCWSSVAAANGWGTAGFGASIGTLHNAYYDWNGLAAAASRGSKHIRDVLLIGNPTYGGNNGRVYACLPDSSAGTSTASFSGIDQNTSLTWACGYDVAQNTASNPSRQLMLDPPTGYSGLYFGSSIQGVKNALLYKKDPGTGLTSDGNSAQTSLNLGYPGAAVIGATGNPPGAFVFYGVHFPEGGANVFTSGSPPTRDVLGAARNQYLFNLFQYKNNLTTPTALSVVSEHPCSTVDPSTGNVPGSYTAGNYYAEVCNVQLISPPSSGWNGTGFGNTLFAVPASNDSSSLMDKQTILAIPAPNRNLSNGTQTFYQLGTVQLYYQNIQTSSDYSTGFFLLAGPGRTCNAGSGFCRYSDGFSSSLTGSVDFDGTPANNIHFGGGGVAAGPVETGTTSDYATASDFIVGVPGYIYNPAPGITVSDNGAAELYFSLAGTFRNYRITATDTTQASPWHTMNRSYGQESDVRYFQAIAMGDINHDGVDDVAVRLKSGSVNKIRVFNGNLNNTVGFQTKVGTYSDISVQGDPTAGTRLVPMGKITNGQFPAFLITGAQSSYIYFDGVGGLIPGQPSAFALGGSPRKLSDNGASSYLSFADSSFYHPASTLSAADVTVSFAHGDFNGDGYEDFAIGYPSNISPTDTVVSPGNPFPGMPSASGVVNSGRVLVFYGGAGNGFQVQPDVTGGYPITDSYLAPYSRDNSVTVDSVPSYPMPCNAATGICTRIQELYEGKNTSGTTATSNFGETLTAVPMGTCTFNGVTNKVSGLLVKSQVGSASQVYVYKPHCVEDLPVGSETHFDGLIREVNTANTTFLNTQNATVHVYNTIIPSTILAAPTPSSKFGRSMVTVDNILGASSTSSQARTHVVLADQDRSSLFVFPVEPNPNGGTTDRLLVTDDPGQGGQIVNYGASNMLAGTNGINAGFGDGMADVGDINGDGYADVMVSVSQLTRKGSIQAPGQGAALMLFGSKNGLQSLTNSVPIEPIQNANCFISFDGTSAVSACNPTLIYAPQPNPASTTTCNVTPVARTGTNDMLFVSKSSHLDFGAANENLGTFLIGIPKRDTTEYCPSDRILTGGAFYVLP